MADLEAVRLRLEELQRSTNEDGQDLSSSDQPLSPKRGWQWLAELPEDAQELADLLNEAAPALGLHNYKKFTHSLPYLKSDKTRRFPDDINKKRTKQRLQTAIPISIAPGHIDWTRLIATISTEDLAFTSPTNNNNTNTTSTTIINHTSNTTTTTSPLSTKNNHLHTPPPPQQQASPSPSTTTTTAAAASFTPMTNTLVEVNSGGKVLFCLFEPQLSTSSAPTPAVSRQVTPTPMSMVPSIFKAIQNANNNSGNGNSNSDNGNSNIATTPTMKVNNNYNNTMMSPQPSSSMNTTNNDKNSNSIGLTIQQPSSSSSSPFTPTRHHNTTTNTNTAIWNSLQDNTLEGCIVVKFVSSRLLCQSEQFANELAQHVGVCAPESRILRNTTTTITSGSSSLSLASSTMSLSSSNSIALNNNTMTTTLYVNNNENTNINNSIIANNTNTTTTATATTTNNNNTMNTNNNPLPTTPTPMILSSDTTEWTIAYRAAKTLADNGFPDLYDEMSRNNHMLIMEFIPGKGLLSTPSAFQPDTIDRTFSDIGRLFALDMLLGNSDRLRCEALGWRGNDENVMAGLRGRYAGKVVAIDAVVQRRPPGGLMSSDDAACERMVELALNDGVVAAAALAETIERCPEALQALSSSFVIAKKKNNRMSMMSSSGNDDDDNLITTALDNTNTTMNTTTTNMTTVYKSKLFSSPLVYAFQDGLRRGLDSMMGLKGLLEMMFQQISNWISEFIEDIESTVRAEAAIKGNSNTGMSNNNNNSTMMSSMHKVVEKETHKIRQIKHEAARNRSVSEKVANWKSIFRSRGEDLRAAVEEWQVKRSMSPSTRDTVTSPRTAACLACRLTTGFLDGTHPVVDVYELKVRLEHMLQRLRVLQQASATDRPTQLFPSLFLSGAVAASSFHTLRHLGITHIINATEDLLLPDTEQGFDAVRFPLRDVEEEDISQYFTSATEYIDGALESGGAVLVHCHAGQSRSCTLVLAWLMICMKWTLKNALEFLHQHRPQAAPNAGYMAALARLEEELFGTQTVKVKKTKPELKVCPVCGEKVGLSAESVRVHLRMKHHPGAMVHQQQ